MHVQRSADSGLPLQASEMEERFFPRVGARPELNTRQFPDASGHTTRLVQKAFVARFIISSERGFVPGASRDARF